MADRSEPRPLPPGLRDLVESSVREVPTAHRWAMRRLAERTFAEGFGDGYVTGMREAHADADR